MALATRIPSFWRWTARQKRAIIARFAADSPPRQSTHRRHSRSVILWMIGTLIGLSFALNGLLDTSRPDWRDLEFGQRQRHLKRLVKYQTKRPLWVMLGSSRTQMGVTPAEMQWEEISDPPIANPPMVFNAGQSGCGPPMQLVNLERLLRAGIKPDRILLEIMAKSLSKPDPVESQFEVSRLTWADMNVLAPYAEDLATLRLNWFRLRLSPWSTYRHTIASKWCPELLPAHERKDPFWVSLHPTGWMAYATEEISAKHRERATELACQEYSAFLKHFRVNVLADAMLRRVLDRCKEEQIPVTLYTMPEGHSFRRWYGSDTIPAMRDYLRVIRDIYGVEMVWEPREWFDDDWFVDSHHLLPRGARAFSRRFAREVLLPILRESSP